MIYNYNLVVFIVETFNELQNRLIKKKLFKFMLKLILTDYNYSKQNTVDEHNHSSSIPSSISLFNSTLKPNDSSGSGKFLTVPGKHSFLNLSSHNTGNGSL